MSDRRAEIRAFLDTNGFAGASPQPLAGDASARRYERITAPRPAVLMDCPPDKLQVRPFLEVHATLEGLGYSVPALYAADPARGLVLLEDLGETSFSRTLDVGGDHERLYGAAVDLLVDLQRRAPIDGLPAYDDARFMTELELLPTFAVPGLPATAADAYRTLWRRLLGEARFGPACFVYVDYHADNLHWLDERSGH
ncbi:MAG: phosphotransferase, partial [Geminicoccaceae bacterium]|nr:phosphotransferase [Geminicoccaceae bacterium]